MTIDVTVNGDEYTDEYIELFYYEEPTYSGLSIDEAPSNLPVDVYIPTDFKKNHMDKIRRYHNATIRYTCDGGAILYSRGEITHFPLDPTKR
jgi:hypothetical protein